MLLTMMNILNNSEVVLLQKMSYAVRYGADHYVLIFLPGSLLELDSLKQMTNRRFSLL